ncbi:UDP-glucuronate 4-epimerase [Limimonas halophila]|uniref:UDP-glucuronate 4-epimerase n=1 Tax=Limimonas halophila TaxID=1082479 RepID=A0A1G7SA98_9PROT|nr:NAD-dependent epimerase/dehydratase family protein [Limimonas halophila]SDG19891.1 UDP-glucuronate 4-epimerase [Limimonas halophila]
MAVLITGVAGFIGSHLARALLDRGERVVGLDALTDDGALALKHDRLAPLRQRDGFDFHRGDVADSAELAEVVAAHPDIDRIVHLAARAGVRESIAEPLRFVDANVRGQVAVLEAARRLARVRHIVYASSSSVYGRSTATAFREDDRADAQESVYGATKRAGELMAQTYAQLYPTPMTGLRFFTVYGPWGRPDMAYSTFTDAILSGRPLTLYGHGRARRDFTHIDDIVAGILAALDRPPEGPVPHRVYNLGNSHAEPVSRFVAVLEAACGREADKRYADLPPGDVPYTAAHLTRVEAELGYRPTVSIDTGLPAFVAWYRWYHGL